MARVCLALGDDWDGLYIDGKLVEQGHSIQPAEAMRAVLNDITPPLTRGDVEVREVDYSWLEDRGSLPDEISEVIWRKP